MTSAALGLTLVIAAGETDLSLPSVITFSSILFASFYRFDLVPWMSWIAEGVAPDDIPAMQAQMAWIGLVVAVAAGAFAGWVNGTLVAKAGANTVFTLAVDATTGIATFNLNDQLDHTGIDDDDETAVLNLDDTAAKQRRSKAG